MDYRYAGAQEALARRVAEDHIARGRKVWCAAHWGLQYYLEKAGAEELDALRGGWDRVRPGDVVVVSRVNSNVTGPKKPIRSNVTRITVGHPLPLRLISGWTGEGGFYSNVTGFLPFSLSAEPLEEFTIIEAL